MMLSIVIPVFKSKASIHPLFNLITNIVHAIPDFSNYEVIMVEDCGEDGSWEIIQQIAKTDSHLKGIKLSRNFGQHHAITAGMDLCKGDWVVVMDCDLQDDPKAIVALWNKAKEGYDVVNARRYTRQDHYIKRYRSLFFHKILQILSGINYDPYVANFRIMSRKVVDVYKQMRENTRVIGAQIQWLGFSSAYVDITHSPRRHGKSSYTLNKLLNLAIDVAVSYSNKPLYISIYAGVAISFTSFIIATWFFIRHLIWKIPVEGWTSTIVSLWLIGGIIIANLGVIGIYISKIYNETKQRPLYAISERVNC